MEISTVTAIGLCRQAHERLFAGLAGLDDETARRPSRLPDWTVGHVLTHLARNADGHTQRIEGALRGEEVRRYPGGDSQRNGDIETGAGASAAELIADVTESAQRLDETFARAEAAGWPNAHLMGGDSYPVTQSPLRRLREVEVHHFDLSTGYPLASWSDDYVAWELESALRTLPERFQSPADARAFLAWAIRGEKLPPEGLDLKPW
jgi:maleylpyruvate isomerase